MLFLPFQQAIMRDKVSGASDDELAKIEDHIKARFDYDTKMHEEPWHVMKKDDNDDPEDLERLYVTAYVSCPLGTCNC